MSHEIHEHIEHAEHASHEAGTHSSLPQWIGITVAVLGVILALCSAQLGAARTELIATMVEENGAKARYVSVGNKYRALSAQLQQLHAAMPDPDKVEKNNRDLKALVADIKNPDTLHAVKAGELQTEKILTTVTPTKADVERFLALVSRTRDEAGAAHEWSESYTGMIRAHENIATYFELALLGSEIGIVIASVGLLLSKRQRFARTALITAAALGVASLSIAGGSKMFNTPLLHAAEKNIEHAKVHFDHLNQEDEDLQQDIKLENGIRADIERLTGAPSVSSRDD